MNILYLAAIRLPTDKAHGVQIMKTCEAFALEGAQVELMVPIRLNSISENPFSYYRVKELFKITPLKSVDFFTTGSKLGFMFSLLSFSEAVHFTRQFWKADVIYSRDAFVLAQYVLLGRSLVYEAHTAPTFLSRFIARRASHVVVISNGLRDAYLRAGVAENRIIIAPDAIDFANFARDREGAESKEEARVRLGLPLNKYIALYIGRLDGWKGVNTLCEAAELLPDNVCVAIIGGEPEQVQAMKLKYPRVLFLGYSPYTMLPNNQAAADVLILPNTATDTNSQLYTSPMKLFAYMASERPIIASNLASVREVLTDDNAFFFTPDDHHSLADVIQKTLYADSVHAEAAISKAHAARKDVEAYTWNSRAQSILLKL